MFLLCKLTENTTFYIISVIMSCFRETNFTTVQGFWPYYIVLSRESISFCRYFRHFGLVHIIHFYPGLICQIANIWCISMFPLLSMAMPMPAWSTFVLFLTVIFYNKWYPNSYSVVNFHWKQSVSLSHNPVIYPVFSEWP